MPERASGAKVSQDAAMDAWAIVARDVLLTTARRYRAVTTYKELAASVQEISGITTKQRLDYWIGRLLEKVATETARRGEPPLTALCVHQDGTIGPGYARAPKSVEVDDSIDVDDLAAEHRLLCYRAFAEDLPQDGGSAALTPQVSARRIRQKHPAETVRPVCPKHFLEMSVTGQCADCD